MRDKVFTYYLSFCVGVCVLGSSNERLLRFLYVDLHTACGCKKVLSLDYPSKEHVASGTKARDYGGVAGSLKRRQPHPPSLSPLAFLRWSSYCIPHSYTPHFGGVPSVSGFVFVFWGQWALSKRELYFIVRYKVVTCPSFPVGEAMDVFVLCPVFRILHPLSYLT